MTKPPIPKKIRNPKDNTQTPLTTSITQEAEVLLSVVSLISASPGYIWSWKFSNPVLFIDKASSMCVYVKVNRDTLHRLGCRWEEGRNLFTLEFWLSNRKPFLQKPRNVVYQKHKHLNEAQNRSTEGWSRLKRSVDITSSGKNGLNIRTNASPKWDRTRCPEE